MSKSWARGSTTAWRKLRAVVLLRDGFECQLRREGCIGTATHAAHIVPKSRGGADIESNLVAACAPCNLGEGARAPDPPLQPRTVW